MKKYILLFLILLCPVFVDALEINETSVDEYDEEEKKVTVTLDKCVDGDTANFKTSDGLVVAVRFLAIDTPETVHPTKEEERFGKEASEYTCTNLTNATEITLEYDSKADVDSYGRTLAWVFTDDNLLESLLVDRGYAKVAYLYDDYKYTSTLKEKEEIAKTNKLGIWSDEEDETSSLTDEVEITDNKKNESGIMGFINKILNSIVDLFDKLLGSLIDLINGFLNADN